MKFRKKLFGGRFREDQVANFRQYINTSEVKAAQLFRQYGKPSFRKEFLVNKDDFLFLNAAKPAFKISVLISNGNVEARCDIFEFLQ